MIRLLPGFLRVVLGVMTAACQASFLMCLAQSWSPSPNEVLQLLLRMICQQPGRMNEPLS
jgi:hypothetical protein